ENHFTQEDIGKTFIVSVSDCMGQGNLCWGYVKIEEKQIPLIECPDNITVFCGDDISPESVGFAQLKSCEPLALIYHVDNIESFPVCHTPRSNISRKWYIDDQQGNIVQCTQSISVHPIPLNNIVWPEDIEVENALE